MCIYIISPVELPEANCRRSGCPWMPPDAAPQRCDSQGQRCPESQDSPPGCNLEEGMDDLRETIAFYSGNHGFYSENHGFYSGNHGFYSGNHSFLLGKPWFLLGKPLFLLGKP